VLLPTVGKNAQFSSAKPASTFSMEGAPLVTFTNEDEGESRQCEGNLTRSRSWRVYIHSNGTVVPSAESFAQGIPLLCGQLTHHVPVQECHPDVRVVNFSLLAKILKLYGKTAMKAGDTNKAEHLFSRLCNMYSVCFPQLGSRGKLCWPWKLRKRGSSTMQGDEGKGGQAGRQIDGAEACMLLGAVLTTQGQYSRAGDVYGQAMQAVRSHLPADHKLKEQLESQMIALLRAQQDGKKC
jgi:hypothetical protein